MPKKIILIIIGIILISGIAIFLTKSSGGLIGSGLTGKYISEVEPENYLILKKDGTFYIKYFYSSGGTGKYTVEDNMITLRDVRYGGINYFRKIDDNTLADVTGVHWKKQ